MSRCGLFQYQTEESMKTSDREQGEKDKEGNAKGECRKKGGRELNNRASVPRRVSRSGCVLSGRAYIEMESGPWNKTAHPR